MPKNSSPYRKPPVKRTRDSFIDDKNLVEKPRIDLGQSRQTQIRRDKDTVKSIGITLYDIDFAVKSFIESVMQLRIEDNGLSIPVPVLYANSEKWTSIQRNGYLKDKKGKTLVPLITFRRSAVNMKNELRRNKVATTNQMGYAMKQKYNKNSPYDKFSTLYGNNDKSSGEYFITPIPDYVDITYDFISWTEYQNQLNYLIEQFIYFTGQSFGERNSLKFSTNAESFTMEDNNTTGQDRVVRCTFQITVHGYLLPRSVGTEITTRKIIGPNKVIFGLEGFNNLTIPSSVNNALFNPDRISGGGNNGNVRPRQNQYRNLNTDDRNKSEDLRRRLEDFEDISLNRSPDVYPTEND